MNAKQLGEQPAFASEHQTGMTLRQYFAGLAMQGYIATGQTWTDNEQRVALASLKHADALLAELAAKEQGK